MTLCRKRLKRLNHKESSVFAFSTVCFYNFVFFLIWQQEAQRQQPNLAKVQPAQEDLAWLDADLSNLDQHEPYEWAEGELEQGKPLEKYVVGRGLVIEE